MQRLQLLGIACGVVLLALSAYTALDVERREAAHDLDAVLRAQSTQVSRELGYQFESTRALTLLLADDPAFPRFYEDRGTADDRARDAALGDIVDAMVTLGDLYPKTVGDICLVGRSGTEDVCVDGGRVVAVGDPMTHRPSLHVAHTLLLEPGQVHHSSPYVASGGDRVLATSTPVRTASGKPGVVRIEVMLEHLRERALSGTAVLVAVVDATDGRTLFDSERPVDVADGGRTPTAPDIVRSATVGEAGMATVDGHRLAFRRMGPLLGSNNDWIVVARAPVARGPSLLALGPLQIGLVTTALVLLLVSALSHRAHQRRLQEVALTDELTGLPNRALFADRIARALLDAARDGSTTVIAMIDIDRFKDINDTLGHGVGDLVLREVGRRFATALRATDTVARLGGDEFGLVLRGLRVEREARDLVRRCVAVLAEPVRVGELSVQVTASIGVAVAPADGAHGDTLLQHAEMAMYEAKRSGEDVVFYECELDTFDPRRLAMVPELRAAIERGEVTTNFQPKLRLIDRCVDGVEVLARWTHPDFGVVSPAEFIPLAEETGLIRPLTISVLDQALGRCREWLELGLEVPVSVNLSVRNLEDPDVVVRIGELLGRHRLPPRLLKIEITESEALTEAGRALQCLQRLRARGIELSLDDFGTGQSSLSHIRHLPVAELKIDRSFVAGMRINVADASIVRSAIQLGRDLGLRTVAEGVEDEVTIARLEELGCDIAQGFAVARPMPPEEITGWLARRAVGRARRVTASTLDGNADAPAAAPDRLHP